MLDCYQLYVRRTRRIALPEFTKFESRSSAHPADDCVTIAATTDELETAVGALVLEIVQIFEHSDFVQVTSSD